MKFSFRRSSASRILETFVFAAFLFAVSPALAQEPDANPELLSAPAFVLPDEARAAGVDGTMTVNLSLDKSGAVKQVFIIAGPAWPCGTSPGGAIASVRKAAKENLLATKFSPLIKDGRARGADLQLTFAIGQAYKDAVKEQEVLKPTIGSPKLVDAGMINGRAISLPRPTYPDRAASQRISGPVGVKVLIDESGKVALAGAVSGHPYLQDAARDAACEAKFSPTSIKGVPVRVSGMITYDFRP